MNKNLRSLLKLCLVSSPHLQEPHYLMVRTSGRWRLCKYMLQIHICEDKNLVSFMVPSHKLSSSEDLEIMMCQYFKIIRSYTRCKFSSHSVGHWFVRTRVLVNVKDLAKLFYVSKNFTKKQLLWLQKEHNFCIKQGSCLKRTPNSFL